MSYVPDNYDMFCRHDAEQERALRRLPVCCRCKEHIQQEKAVCCDDKWYCKDCENELWEELRKDYLESTDL